MFLFYFQGRQYFLSRRNAFLLVAFVSCSYVLFKELRAKKKLKSKPAIEISRGGDETFLVKIDPEHFERDLMECLAQEKGLYQVIHRGLKDKILNTILANLKTYGKPTIILISREIFRLIISIASKETLVMGGPQFGVLMLNWKVNLATLGLGCIPAILLKYTPIQLLLLRALIAAFVTIYAHPALAPTCGDFTQWIQSYPTEHHRQVKEVTYLNTLDIDKEPKIYVENLKSDHKICVDQNSEDIILPERRVMTLQELESQYESKNPCDFIPKRNQKRDVRMVPLSKRTKTFEDLLAEIDSSKRLNKLQAGNTGNLVGYDENLEYTRVPYAGRSRVRLNTGKREPAPKPAATQQLQEEDNQEF